MAKNPSLLFQKKAKPNSSSDIIIIKALPHDVIARIAASFTPPDLIGASLVCIAWRDALKPLREAMVFIEAGRILKREHKRVNGILSEALSVFLKGAAYGSTLAMVEAGLIYSEIGRRDEAVLLYRRAAELGDPAGHYNLAMFYFNFQVNSPNNMKAAIAYLYKAAAGSVPAQYQLGLCFHQGRGVRQCLQEAAQWYLRAAEGGYMRAMFNTSILYLQGQGFPRDYTLGRMWSLRAIEYIRRNSCDYKERDRCLDELEQKQSQRQCYTH